METKRILEELRAERDRLQRAISAIEGISSTAATGRDAARRARPRLSAAARKRISQARKLWWAQKRKRAQTRQITKKKKKTAPKAAKKTSRKAGTSAAGGRNRLSEITKKTSEERKSTEATTA
jgi:ABC-type transporter Mla subunit MlaD